MSRVRNIFNRISTNIICLFKTKFPLGKKVYLIGTPEYSNLGDSAIAIAEMNFLFQCGYKKSCIKEITQSEFNEKAGYFCRFISKRSLICGIGGGNFGNLWYNEELFRYSLIEAFPDNPIIIFPQTVFFTDDESGENAIIKSKVHYNGHRNLTLVAREKQSLSLLKTLYSKAEILLSPDIVLSSTIEDYGVTFCRRFGVLLVFRNDLEQSMSNEDRKNIKSYLDSKLISFRQTDMHADVPVTKENRIELVRNKMQEFANARLVITDRLHGMIFAAITGTPCIVFGNNHYKVLGSYEWISYLPYIEFVDDVNNAFAAFERLYTTNAYYNNERVLEGFTELKSLVESKRHR